MAFLEQWFIPLLIVAAVFLAIYLYRTGARRGASRGEARPGMQKTGKPQPVAQPLAAPAATAFGQGRPGLGRKSEPEWVPIQTAIGSERALLPTAGLLRQSGVEARIVRVTLVPGRRLVRLAVRQADLRRAREVLSREDLYVRSRLHS